MPGSTKKTPFLGRMFRRSVILLIIHLYVFQGLGIAEEGGKKISDESLRMPGIFNSVLPGTEEKNSFKLRVHTHFGDITKRDYIRNDLGFSYGLYENWDIIAKTRLYFGHGLKKASFGEDPGLADYILETKYAIGDAILPTWDAAVKFSYASPIGNPAPRVTDGLIHRATTLSFARQLESRPGDRVFFGLTTDIITETDVIARIEKNDLRESFQEISGGFVIERDRIHYTFESSIASTRLWGNGSRDVFSVGPGFLLQVPRRFTFNSKSEWLIGAATPITFGPDGTDIGLSVKLRFDFDFKRSRKNASGPQASEVASVAGRSIAGYSR